MPAAWAVGRDPVEIGLATVVVGLGLASLGGFLGRLAWWLDLLGNLHLHLAVVAVAVAAIAVAMRRHRWAALAVLLAGANLMPAASLLGADAAAAPAGALRIAAVDMGSTNDDPAAILKQLADDPADVVLLSRFQRRWRPLLAPLFKTYRYHYVGAATAAPPDRAEPVLLSRWPFRRVDAIATDTEHPPLALRAVIGRLTVFGVHLPPPLAPSSPRESAAARAALQAAVKAETGAVAVIGDFGTTPYTASYQRLVEATGLRRAPAGVAATFPASLGPVGLPLDHLLLGPGVAGGFHTAVAPGSDHRLLRGWVSLAGNQDDRPPNGQD